MAHFICLDISKPWAINEPALSVLTQPICFGLLYTIDEPISKVNNGRGYWRSLPLKVVMSYLGKQRERLGQLKRL